MLSFGHNDLTINAMDHKVQRMITYIDETKRETGFNIKIQEFSFD